ncbi:putative nuclear pore complex protein nup155 [Fasciola hepatica]|uniref:Nuclear pore complex protein nup155 n=1 Tax=Fasciola hepatica TaxID=6192 RepID=A0A4E0QU40_FASHE|nr:putative nuclear pore complex protein nup155 [Fasciola hepatica]
MECTKTSLLFSPSRLHVTYFLSECFGSAPDKVSVSGTREIDYPSTHFRAGGELEVSKSFSLPPDLVEKFSGMQKNCLMGVFTACERAWISIDNELFMWNYEDG